MINLALERETKKYVRAILDFAIQKNMESVINADMKSLQDTFKSIFDDKTSTSEYLEVRKQFKALSSVKKKVVIKNILDGSKISQVTKNFMFILLNAHKLHLIRKIALEWDHLYLEYKGHLKVTVTSFLELTEQEKKQITDNLKKTFGDDIYLVSVVDKSILGGLIFEIKNKIYDDSIKHKINKISNNLKGTNSYE